MQATPEHIEALEKLQALDRLRWQAEAELKDMPHRQKVLDGRLKRKEIEAKFEQVSQMLNEARAAKQKLLDEDERLQIKQEETQAKINESQDDYRSITKLTRDLEGMVKRRETLEFQGKTANERLSQVQEVFDSAQAALDAIDAREKQLVAEYQVATAQHTATVKQCLEQRASLIAQLPEEVVQAYETALEKCGGVGLSTLQGEKCGACRAQIDANRLLQVHKEAPLSHCPSCGRVLIVT